MHQRQWPLAAITAPVFPGLIGRPFPDAEYAAVIGIPGPAGHGKRGRGAGSFEKRSAMHDPVP